MPQFLGNGAEIAYEDAGSGHPLLFVHGLGAEKGMFAPQVERFALTHRTICLDLRGNGRSSRIEGPIDTILDRQCDDVVALLDFLGMERIVLVGVSYGGMLGFHFALRHPNRLAGFVAADAMADARATNLFEWMLTVVMYATIWAYYLPPSWFIPPTVRLYARWPLARQYLAATFPHLRRHEAILQRLALARARHFERLGEIRVPMVAMAGGAVPLAVRFIKRAIDAMPGVHLEIIDDAQDPSNLCQPERFNQLLGDFLAGLGW